MTHLLQFVGMLTVLGSELLAAESQSAISNHGQIQITTFGRVREGFAQPEMIYAPFSFWFWDEPLDASKYPEKAKTMARALLKQGMNPGYAHPRVSMADLVGPKVMSPSPSLPKEQWLSSEWFQAFEGALQEAETAKGYLGYVDDYMWPVGRGAGRVVQAHPELANASLQWEVTDVAGGQAVELPPSFFTVAAQLLQKPETSNFSIPASVGTFDLVDLTGVDLYGNTSLGQTVCVETRRLDEISILLTCWKATSDAKFTIEARSDGPEGRILASRHINGGVNAGDSVSLTIKEVLPVGSKLYVGMIPDPGFPSNEVGWWSKPNDAYVGGTAFINGKPVVGDRTVKLSYLTQPDVMQGEWIWQPEVVHVPHTCYFRKSFDLQAGQVVAKAVVKITADNRYKLFVNGSSIGHGDDWSQPGTHDVLAALRSGRNTMAVEGGGDGGLDAILCDLTLDMTSGEQLRITSDGSWLVATNATAGWKTSEFNEAEWRTVRVIGPAKAMPWNLSAARLPYQQMTIRSATLQIIGSGDKFNWTAPTDGYWRVYTFRKSVGGDVNCLDERLAAAFIDVVHKAHADHFGVRMGKSIPGVFCDTEGNYGNGNGLAWSDSLSPRYLANTGRDIRLWMPLMLDDDEEGVSARARFDWFEAVSDLYAGFYAGVSDWLAERGMYYIANVWEESLQCQASCVSDHMKVQRAHSMPGCDALGLKAYDVHDFKEAQSVAEFESRRTMNELMGAGGWPTFNPVTMKECVNSVVAWGVSHVVHHGVFMTRGLTGNVWVPDWYDENPMWPHLHLWSDFVRRATYVNSQGCVNPDVLLLNPMESVWALLGNTDRLWWSPEAGHVGLIDQLYSKHVQEINTIYSDAMRQLTSHRVEYLIADRHYVNQMAVSGKQLVRGEFRFKTLVLPPMVVLPLKVARKIVDFVKAGGNVYTLGELPNGSTDNGLKDPVMATLMAELRALPNVTSCPQGLAHALNAKSPGIKSPMQFVSGEFPMLELRRRIDNRDFFWLVNNSDQARQCVVQAADVQGGASVWDCETGKIRPVACTKNTNGAQLQLAFQPHEAYWLVFDPEQPAQSEPIMALPKEEVVLGIDGAWNVRADTAAQPHLEHPVQIPDSLTGSLGVAHDLTLWDTWQELPGNFSGLLDYTKTVNLPAFEGPLVLDLGKVNHFADVWVNGKHVGAKLWPPHKFQTDAFRSGSNEIRIRVGNLVNNNYDLSAPSGLMGPVMVKTVSEGGL